MKKNHKIILVAVAFLAAVMSSGYFFHAAPPSPSIKFLCGAGMKTPITEIIQNFETETGNKVHVFFEGSAILNEYISTFRSGDLFLPGDKENLDILQKQGLVTDSSFLAWHTGAILIPPSLKDRIRGVDDLAGEGVRLAMPNPRQTSLGRLVMKNIINRHPAGDRILGNIVVYGSSCQDVLDRFRESNADVLFEWDVMATTPEGQGLIVVPIAGPYQVKDPMHLGLLATARNPTLARQFYAYLLTKGREVFRKHGYNVEEGT